MGAPECALILVIYIGEGHQNDYKCKISHLEVYDSGGGQHNDLVRGQACLNAGFSGVNWLQNKENLGNVCKSLIFLKMGLFHLVGN